MRSVPTTIHPLLPSDYEQVETRYDEAERTLWVYMDARPRPCFTEVILDELRTVQQRVDAFNARGNGDRRLPVEYLVVASAHPTVWSLGGDLDLFSVCVERGGAEDMERLRGYARKCIDIGFWNCVGGARKPTVISLVQGEALGGGFEGAISAPFVVAEEQARFGLPEILFGHFPGMGGFTYLRRRLDASTAERLMLNGEVLSAQDLCDLGVVHEVAGEGQGELAVVEFIQRHRRRANAYLAVRRIRDRWDPLSYDELADVTEEWVQAAQRLSDRDLRLMRRLVRAQDSRMAKDIRVSAGG